LNLEEQNSEDNTEIARPRTISGIDALYFHLEIPYEDYSEFYHKSLLARVLELDTNFIMKSYDYDKQFTYFDVTNDTLLGLAPDVVLCTIGFKNLNLKDNRDFITIQASSIALNYYGYKECYDLIREQVEILGLPILKSKASRLDLNTYVINHNFDYLTYSLFSTKMRNNAENGGYDTWKHKDRLNGFNLGSRKSKGIYLRMYDKWLELMQSKNADIALIKMKILSEKYEHKYKEKLSGNMPPDIWQVEFELKRDILRRYGIDTVEDVFIKADSIHKDITLNQVRLINPIRAKKRDCPTSEIWKMISDNYSVFKDNVEPLSPEKCKVYTTTDEQRVINAIDDYLGRKAEFKEPISEEIMYHIKSLKTLLFLDTSS